MARVLVVDDEPAIRSLIRTTLEGEGHSVLEATDGPSGLEAARAHQPDLVLLDVALPGLSGLDVCRLLKAGPNPTRAAILLLSGLPQVTDEPPAGADGSLPKPFTPDAIVRQVGRALSRGQEAAARP